MQTNNTSIVSLSELNKFFKSQTISSYLNNFSCKNNSDVESFLHSKAVEYEQLGRTKTFLILNNQSEQIEILAYFSLAIHSYKIADNVSNKNRKDLDGKRYKANNSKIETIPAILIAQLAKNDNYKSSISGRDLMVHCMNTIHLGRSYLAGRVLIVECKDIEYLRNFYQSFGFLDITSEKEHLKQFYLICPPTM